MEDAATAEISRSQVWQWVRYGAKMTDGRPITPELVQQVIREEMDHLQGGKFLEASTIFEEMMLKPHYTEFLTLVAYEKI
jgi:malate synthase